MQLTSCIHIGTVRYKRCVRSILLNGWGAKLVSENLFFCEKRDIFKLRRGGVGGCSPSPYIGPFCLWESIFFPSVEMKWMLTPTHPSCWEEELLLAYVSSWCDRQRCTCWLLPNLKRECVLDGVFCEAVWVRVLIVSLMGFILIGFCSVEGSLRLFCL